MKNNDDYVYRIYGKLKTQKKFKPFDAENGVFVTNLMYASMYKRITFFKLVSEVNFMNKNNPGHIFEIRNI